MQNLGILTIEFPFLVLHKIFLKGFVHLNSTPNITQSDIRRITRRWYDQSRLDINDLEGFEIEGRFLSLLKVLLTLDVGCSTCI